MPVMGMSDYDIDPEMVREVFAYAISDGLFCEITGEDINDTFAIDDGGDSEWMSVRAE